MKYHKLAATLTAFLIRMAATPSASQNISDYLYLTSIEQRSGGQKDAAIETIKTLLKLDPEHAQAKYDLALIKAERGKYLSAKAMYTFSQEYMTNSAYRVAADQAIHDNCPVLRNLTFNAAIEFTQDDNINSGSHSKEITV